MLVTAAQFLTLRLILIGSTHVGCDDSDGPGHAPRYLDVSRNIMRKYVYILLSVLVVSILTVVAISLYDVNNELNGMLKSRGYTGKEWKIVYNGLSFNDVPDYHHYGLCFGVKDRAGTVLRIRFIWSIYPFREVLTTFS